MKTSDRNGLIAWGSSPFVMYFVWFMLPFYELGISLIGGWTYLAMLLSWFIGVGWLINILNASSAVKKVADKE